MAVCLAPLRQEFGSPAEGFFLLCGIRKQPSRPAITGNASRIAVMALAGGLNPVRNEGPLSLVVHEDSVDGAVGRKTVNVANEVDRMAGYLGRQ